MLATQRHSAILEALRRRGAVRVTDLAGDLRVSEMTIRRDLDVLGGSGLIEKVHGGATLVSSTTTYEPGFLTKMERQRPEKAAIASAAAAMVRPGMAVGLSAGTTTWALADQLKAVPDITVVTNSIPIANLFHSEPGPNQTVVLTGGVRTPGDALVGPVAALALRTTHLDLVFMSVYGIDADAGITSPNLLEADTNRELLRITRRLVVLADHTKVGVVGLSTIASLDQVHLLIVDDGIPADTLTPLRERVTLVLAATTATTKRAGRRVSSV